MKYFLLILMTIYQRLISPLLKQLLGVNSMCRFSPSCSAYAGIVIQKEGAIRGFGKSLRRLLRCQTFFDR